MDRVGESEASGEIGLRPVVERSDVTRWSGLAVTTTRLTVPSGAPDEFRTLGPAFASQSRSILKSAPRLYLMTKFAPNLPDDVLALADGILFKNNSTMLPSFAEALSGISIHRGNNQHTVLDASRVMSLESSCHPQL